MISKTELDDFCHSIKIMFTVAMVAVLLMVLAIIVKVLFFMH